MHGHGNLPTKHSSVLEIVSEVDGMRIYYSKTLTRIVEGQDDWLELLVRMESGSPHGWEEAAVDLASEIKLAFNEFLTAKGQDIDYYSGPDILPPAEFVMKFDIENLLRLAREALIDHIPSSARAWQAKYSKIRDLWIGGEGQLLSKQERAPLRRVMREVARRPVLGKSFELSSDIRAEQRGAGAAAIRDVGGIVVEAEQRRSDYFVTDDPEEQESATKNGAIAVINTLELRLMLRGARGEI